MIKGFERQTYPLTDYEREVLLPRMISGLRKAIGKERAISNAKIVKILAKEGLEVTDIRVRKIINHIRVNGLIRLLVANSKGYYIATKREEVIDYIDSLRGRESAIRDARVSLEQQLQPYQMKMEMA